MVSIGLPLTHWPIGLLDCNRAVGPPLLRPPRNGFAVPFVVPPPRSSDQDQAARSPRGPDEGSTAEPVRRLERFERLAAAWVVGSVRCSGSAALFGRLLAVPRGVRPAARSLPGGAWGGAVGARGARWRLGGSPAAFGPLSACDPPSRPPPGWFAAGGRTGSAVAAGGSVGWRRGTARRRCGFSGCSRRRLGSGGRCRAGRR